MCPGETFVQGTVEDESQYSLHSTGDGLGAVSLKSKEPIRPRTISQTRSINLAVEKLKLPKSSVIWKAFEGDQKDLWSSR